MDLAAKIAADICANLMEQLLRAKIKKKTGISGAAFARSLSFAKCDTAHPPLGLM